MRKVSKLDKVYGSTIPVDRDGTSTYRRQRRSKWATWSSTLCSTVHPPRRYTSSSYSSSSTTTTPSSSSSTTPSSPALATRTLPPRPTSPTPLCTPFATLCNRSPLPHINTCLRRRRRRAGRRGSHTRATASCCSLPQAPMRCRAGVMALRRCSRANYSSHSRTACPK